MNKENLAQEIHAVFGKLIGVLARFDSDQIDQIPQEGSWSAGQVGEHLLKGLSGMPRLVAGKTEKTDRPHDEKVQAIRDLFLDFSTKMQSPDFILPTQDKHDKENIIGGLRQIESELAGIAQNTDLSLVCLDFELPGFGTFTVCEWISFFLAHAQRHTHQLENIDRRINS